MSRQLRRLMLAAALCVAADLSWVAWCLTDSLAGEFWLPLALLNAAILLVLG